MLSLHNVEASYKRGMKILQSVTLEAARDEIVCLIGPNGAGKSTVMKAVMGLVRVDGGTITLDGETITGRKPNEVMLRGISYVPQGRTVFPDMTVWENLRMGGFILKDKRQVEARIEEVYRMFPVLAEHRHRKAYVLSGGEQQMLEMGRALLLDPKYMLIDEPSIGLAPRVRRLVFEVIRRVNAEKGIGVVMVEQNAVQGLENADRGYVLELGSVRLSGSGVDMLHDDRVRELYLGKRRKGA